MIKTLQDISLTTLETLCKTGNERDEINKNLNKLVFPKDQQPQRKNKIRISEQEARLIFIQQLANQRFYYSIETPTIKKYKFTENAVSKRSGSLDLCLYKSDNNKMRRELNIEFKAHNMKNYFQDFEKLFREPGNGMFFHLLESVNNGTLNANNSRKGVLVKYEKSLQKVKKELDNQNGKFVLFVLASLSPKFLISLNITKANINKENIFNLKYSIKNKIISFKKLYNWVLLST